MPRATPGARDRDLCCEGGPAAVVAVRADPVIAGVIAGNLVLGKEGGGREVPDKLPATSIFDLGNGRQK
jgi:hypothetical protein